MKRVSLIVIALLVLIGGGSYWYIKGTPQYSMYQFRKAIVAHDAETAMQYIDIDSVVDNLVNDFMKAEREQQPRDSLEAMGQNFAQGIMMMMLPTMKETLKSQIKTAISTPSGAPEDKTLLKGYRKGDNGFGDFTITTEGNTAILTRKDDKTIKCKMVKTREGFWKVVQFMVDAPARTSN